MKNNRDGDNNHNLSSPPSKTATAATTTTMKTGSGGGGAEKEVESSPTSVILIEAGTRTTKTTASAIFGTLDKDDDDGGDATHADGNNIRLSVGGGGGPNTGKPKAVEVSRRGGGQHPTLAAFSSLPPPPSSSSSSPLFREEMDRTIKTPKQAGLATAATAVPPSTASAAFARRMMSVDSPMRTATVANSTVFSQGKKQHRGSKKAPPHSLTSSSSSEEEEQKEREGKPSPSLDLTDSFAARSQRGQQHPQQPQPQPHELPGKKAPPPAAAAAAAATTTRLSIRQKGNGDSAEVPAMARATPRSHRYLVRGTVAQKHQARRGKNDEEGGGGTRDDLHSGPLLAPAQQLQLQLQQQQQSTSSLLRSTEWTALDMDSLGLVATSSRRRKPQKPPPKTKIPSSPSFAIGAFSGQEPDARTGKVGQDQERQPPPPPPPPPQMTKAPPTSVAVGAVSGQEDRARARAKMEQEKQEQDLGPSLAPARSASTRPRAASCNFNNRNDELPIMPALSSLSSSALPLRIAAVMGRDSNNAQDTNWSALVPATPARALVPSMYATGPDEMPNATTAGITARPGAFAIQGVDAGNESPDDDGSFLGDGSDIYGGPADGNSNRELPGSEYSSDPSSMFLDENPSRSFMDGDDEDDEIVDASDLELGHAPVQAELYEHELVEANIVEDEPENNPKLLRRLRMVQTFVLCFSVVGVACVIYSVLAGFGESKAQETPVPIITGWTKLGGYGQGQTFGPRAQTKQDLIFFGSAVGLSQDGRRIVATAPGVDQGDDLDVGEALILELVNQVWEVAYTLPGVGVNEKPTASLSISKDASLVAVGYPLYENDGRVQIWHESTAFQAPQVLSFHQQQQEEEEDANSSSASLGISSDIRTGFGYSVDLSPDGTMLAVGAPLFESEPNSVTGCVQVFWKQVTTTEEGAETVSWIRHETDHDELLLKGVHPNELFGWSIALRNNRVAVGGPAYDVDRGLVRVLEWSPDTLLWKQVGSDIKGTGQLGRFGESVALSADGSILAVGARGTAFDPGQVQVFRLVNGDWVADHKIFVGQKPGDGLGSSVALSNDGNTLAMGAPENSEFGPGSGQIQVWQYHATMDNGQKWTQHGSNLGGTIGANMGSSVAMSWMEQGNDQGATLRVVGGSPGASFDRSVTKAGSFFVFDREPQ